jgi:hypothetical protein
MAYELDGCRAKIRRAQAHLDTLERRITNFVHPNPYRLVQQRDVGRGALVASIAEAPALPVEEWAVIIGDCVHNLRAALDYIAWQVAGANTGDRETQFPVFVDKQGWRNGGLRRIKRMPVAVQAFIEAVQPYHDPNPHLHWLNGLRVLDDADKHQLLVVTAAVPESYKFEYRNGTPGVKYELEALRDGVLAPGIAVFFVRPIPPLKMDVDIQFTALIALADSFGYGHRLPIVPALASIVRECTLLADKFEKAFPNGP